MADPEMRWCSECREIFLPTDPRQTTCSLACRVAKSRGGRRRTAETRHVQAREVMRILSITDRELRYWLKRYVPPNGERMWGRPQITFPDVFWLAYIARSRETGLGPLRISRGIPRVQRLLETWDAPLSHTTLIQARDSDLLLLTCGAFALEIPAPVVVVEGPALARSLLLRHKRRINEPRRRASSQAGWRLRKREAAAQSSGEREPE